MTYFSAIPVPETEVGIALEVTRGTPVAPAFWLPVMGPKYKPDLQLLPDNTLRGSMVTLYDEVPGLRYDSHGWDSYPYLDTLPVFIRALLGSPDTVTAVEPLTTLVAVALAAAKKVISVAEVKEGLVIVLDAGTATEETRTVTKTTKIKAGEYELEVTALTYEHAIGATVTTTTELIAEAVAGASIVETLNAVAEGTYIVIGVVAGKQETALVTKVTETAPFEFELALAYPLAFTHADKAIVRGLTSHAFSLLNNSPSTGNQPPSCTLTDYAGETDWRELAAAQLDSINITGAADALPKATYAWFANKSVTPSAPEPSYSTAEAPPGWTVQASIGGTQVGYLVNWEFDLKRNVKNIPAITGSQNYYQHFAGPLEVTGKLTVLEDPSATWLTAFENGEQVSIDVTLSDVESGFALNLHTSKSKFTSGDLDRSKEYVEVPLAFQTIPSAADALAGGVSPIKATVANAYTKEF
jgi:adenosine/AMP kinase